MLMNEEQSSPKATIIDTSNKMADKDVWLKVLNLELEGVGVHTHMAELCMLEGLDGFAAMHRAHAVKEYDKFMYMSKKYIENYHIFPKVTMEQKVSNLKLDGNTMPEKMDTALNIYEKWEVSVLDYLTSWKTKISGCKQDINDLISGVNEEIESINDIFPYVEKAKSDEKLIGKIDRWLLSKYSK